MGSVNGIIFCYGQCIIPIATITEIKHACSDVDENVVLNTYFHGDAIKGVYTFHNSYTQQYAAAQYLIGKLRKNIIDDMNLLLLLNKFVNNYIYKTAALIVYVKNKNMRVYHGSNM